jgi:hypothetical protein
MFRAVLLLACACVAAGCGSSSDAPEALTMDEISSAAPNAFAGAQAEIAQLSNEAIEAINQQDYTTAWGKLQDLSARPDLTPEQREFVAQSIASVAAEVARAEEAGDEAARQALQFHRANK